MFLLPQQKLSTAFPTSGFLLKQAFRSSFLGACQAFVLWTRQRQATTARSMVKKPFMVAVAVVSVLL